MTKTLINPFFVIDNMFIFVSVDISFPPYRSIFLVWGEKPEEDLSLTGSQPVFLNNVDSKTSEPEARIWEGALTER